VNGLIWLIDNRADFYKQCVSDEYKKDDITHMRIYCAVFFSADVLRYIDATDTVVLERDGDGWVLGMYDSRTGDRHLISPVD